MIRRVKLKSKDAAALEEFVERVRAALGNNLVEVKLFGSKATGKDQLESDIDVLVAVQEGGVEIEDQVVDIAFDTNVKQKFISRLVSLVAPRSLIPCGAVLLFLKLLQNRALRCETRA